MIVAAAASSATQRQFGRTHAPAIARLVAAAACVLGQVWSSETGRLQPRAP